MVSDEQVGERLLPIGIWTEEKKEVSGEGGALVCELFLGFDHLRREI